jgi:hypothetical protein
MFPQADGKLYPFDTFNLFYRKKYDQKKRIEGEKRRLLASNEEEAQV